MSVNNLLAALGRLGILLKADGDRLRFYPKTAVTPELVECMKAYKGELLEMLRSNPKPAVCRCGSDRYRDNLIHNGQSSRRDCAHCGRFLSFTRWYGSAPSEN